MKELSIEQKAKRYDEALEKARQLCAYPTSKPFISDLQDLLPELKESEDERIRKDIIVYLQYSIAFDKSFLDKKYNWSQKDCCKWIAWLEKQGEQKSAYNEPKFHEGDFIVHHGTENIYQVVAIIDNQYQLKYGDNYTVLKCADVDRRTRLWDITKDAKDGDVLYINNTISESILIYKSFNNGIINKYASYNKFGFEGEHYLTLNNGYIIPATKEQRIKLFQKMHEAGYEWDTDKKELKKIKQEEDVNLTDFESALFSAFSDAWQSYLQGEEVNVKQWVKEHSKELLESTKGKLKGQNSAWSEEDEKMRASIIFTLAGFMGNEDKIDWLKSLKDRCTWKPSDKQLEALKEACDEHWEPDGLDPLYTLYQELKKNYMKGE